MAFKGISDEELATVLEEVNSDIQGLLKTEGTKLKKAVGPFEDEAGVGEPPPPGMGGDEGAPPPGEEELAGPEPAPEAPMEEEGGGDEMGGGDIEAILQALTEEYAQLPDEELELHFVAAKSAYFERMGQGDEGGMEEEMGGEPAPDMGGAPAPEQTPAMKSERPAGRRLRKTEKDLKIEQLEARLRKTETEQKETLSALSMTLETMLGKPMRKAVTSVAHMPKPGEDLDIDVSQLSQDQVTHRLTEKTRDPSLKKSDRDLVNRYYGGTVGVEAIQHLLVDSK